MFLTWCLLGVRSKAAEDQHAKDAEVIDSLSVEKELAEQTCEDTKEEMETLKEQNKGLVLEMERLRQMQEIAAQEVLAVAVPRSVRCRSCACVLQMLKDLPTDQQDVMRLKQQNQQLTDALRQLRDLSMSEKARFDQTNEQSKRVIARLQTDSNALKEARKELEKAKTDIEELKESLDEAQAFEAMVEDLSQKNVELGEKIAELQAQAVAQKEIIDAADEVCARRSGAVVWAAREARAPRSWRNTGWSTSATSQTNSRAPRARCVRLPACARARANWPARGFRHAD